MLINCYFCSYIGVEVSERGIFIFLIVVIVIMRKIFFFLLNLNKIIIKEGRVYGGLFFDKMRVCLRLSSI